MCEGTATIILRDSRFSLIKNQIFRMSRPKSVQIKSAVFVDNCIVSFNLLIKTNFSNCSAQLPFSVCIRDMTAVLIIVDEVSGNQMNIPSSERTSFVLLDSKGMMHCLES